MEIPSDSISKIPYDFAAFATECHVHAEQIAPLQAGCALLYELLMIANQSVNLTRIESVEGFWLKHVADSLLLGKAFGDLTERPLVVGDIGCGAGFPSLVLALAFPAWQIHAIDSVGKKTAFVESAAAGLELQNLTVIHGRSKEMGYRKEFSRKFDLLTARAVGDALKLYTESQMLLKPRGRFLFYKTPQQAESELPRLRELVFKGRTLDWQTTEIFELPASAGARLFLHAQNKI